MYTCAMCGKHCCKSGEMENLPKNCPCGETEQQEKIKEYYSEEENKNIAYHSALVESEGYCKNTRLEEIIDFSRKCGYHKLGVAFCAGLSKEGSVFCSILRHNGFEVDSVICKNGGIQKEFMAIKDNQKVRPGTFEPMCNPIGQAIFLNERKTQLNIILGLCVGHDSLFIKYSEAPVTVFAVKDRVLGHNPIAALYLSDSYYHDKFYK